MFKNDENTDYGVYYEGDFSYILCIFFHLEISGMIYFIRLGAGEDLVDESRVEFVDNNTYYAF